MLSPSYIILEFKDSRANSVDLDEAAYYEPPYQDLCCLQIQLFSSLVLKEFIHYEPPYQDLCCLQIKLFSSLVLKEFIHI